MEGTSWRLGSEDGKKSEKEEKTLASAIHVPMPTYVLPTPTTIFACNETVGSGILPLPARLVL
jgi:hypothetical protein